MAKYKLPKIEELFEAGVHFGHQVRRWNPNMEKYIFGVRSGIHIIDLEQTHENLKEAADFLHEMASEGGQIVFIGTKKQASEIIAIEAKRSGALYVNDRWLGGTITNYSVIKKNGIDKLVKYLKGKESGEFEKYTKKERLMIDRSIAKLEKTVGGIVALQGSPVAVVVVDSRRERTAVKEAKRMGIPVVALIDTNSNPRDLDYVVPGNDDAIRSIALIMKVFGDAVESGYSDYAKKSEAKKAEKEAEKAKALKEAEKKAKAAKPVAKVTGSEAAHTSDKKGKKHAKRVEKGEEKVEEKSEKKATKKSK